jgi:hypothetical protein
VKTSVTSSRPGVMVQGAAGDTSSELTWAAGVHPWRRGRDGLPWRASLAPARPGGLSGRASDVAWRTRRSRAAIAAGRAAPPL